jgi:hypothetical protein
LRETLGVVRALALPECADGLADRTERGLVGARHGRHVDVSAFGAEHGAHGVVAETPPYGVRETGQFGAEHFVRGQTAPQGLCG